MLVSWSTNFLLLITWTQLDLSYKSPSSRTANLDPPRPPETVEVGVKWLELGPLLIIDGLHGPEEVTPGPEDPQHLRHSVGVDGIASEAPGSDDHVVGLLPESGGEKTVNITADEVPVKPESLKSPQGGKVPVQSVNIAVTCRAESACKSGVSRLPPVCSRAERIPEPAATSRISEDRGTPRWKNSSATFSTLLISPGLRDLGTRFSHLTTRGQQLTWRRPSGAGADPEPRMHWARSWLESVNKSLVSCYVTVTGTYFSGSAFQLINMIFSTMNKDLRSAVCTFKVLLAWRWRGDVTDWD